MVVKVTDAISISAVSLFTYTRYNQYALANIRKETPKKKGVRQMITVEDSDDEPYPLDSIVISPNPRKLQFRYPK